MYNKPQSPEFSKRAISILLSLFAGSKPVADMNTSNDQAPAHNGKERCSQPTADAAAVAYEPSITKEPHVNNGFQQGTEQVVNINAKVTNLCDHSTNDMPPTDENQQPTVAITPVETETATHSKDESEVFTTKDEDNPRLKTYINLHNSVHPCLSLPPFPRRSAN